MAVYTTNKKASMDYELLDRFEAGIELFGLEVKSIRKKQMKLEGSRVLVRGGEAYLLNAAIPPYQPSNTPKDYDPERPRRLLFNKKELLELSSKESQKGLTIIPVSVYNKGRNIKIEVRVARRKKKADKREDLKKRDDKRSIERVMKQNTQ
jgi:SsrA-binding protein